MQANIEFYPGQKLTAKDLNAIKDSANSPVQSITQYATGKNIEQMQSWGAKGQKKLPKVFQMTEGPKLRSFPSEPANVDSHVWVHLASLNVIAVSYKGSYFLRNTEYRVNNETISCLNTYAVAYECDDYVCVSYVGPKHFAINDTDIDYNQYDPEYVPKNNYSGWVETPCPKLTALPQGGFTIYWLRAERQDHRTIGNIFLILYSNSGLITGEILDQVVAEASEIKEYEDIYDVKIVQAESLNSLIPTGSNSTILSRYATTFKDGTYNEDPIMFMPWEYDPRYNVFDNRLVQVGTQSIFCNAFLDGDGMHTVMSSFVPCLSGTNYVVVDVPNLSCFLTTED